MRSTQSVRSHGICNKKLELESIKSSRSQESKKQLAQLKKKKVGKSSLTPNNVRLSQMTNARPFDNKWLPSKAFSKGDCRKKRPITPKNVTQTKKPVAPPSTKNAN